MIIIYYIMIHLLMYRRARICSIDFIISLCINFKPVVTTQHWLSIYLRRCQFRHILLFQLSETCSRKGLRKCLPNSESRRKADVEPPIRPLRPRYAQRPHRPLRSTKGLREAQGTVASGPKTTQTRLSQSPTAADFEFPAQIADSLRPYEVVIGSV